MKTLHDKSRFFGLKCMWLCQLQSKTNNFVQALMERKSFARNDLVK